MKFKSIPNKKVYFNMEIVEFTDKGEYETTDKELIKSFGNCADIEKVGKED